MLYNLVLLFILIIGKSFKKRTDSDSRISGISPLLSDVVASATESCWIGSAISQKQNTHLAASEAPAASEVKTEAAGEIGDPNLLYYQV